MNKTISTATIFFAFSGQLTEEGAKLQDKWHRIHGAGAVFPIAMQLAVKAGSDTLIGQVVVPTFTRSIQFQDWEADGYEAVTQAFKAKQKLKRFEILTFDDIITIEPSVGQVCKVQYNGFVGAYKPSGQQYTTSNGRLIWWLMNPTLSDFETIEEALVRETKRAVKRRVSE